MKRYLSYIFLAVMTASCSSTDTVNILISNRSDVEVRNVEVKVACTDINKHLEYAATDTLHLLSETNDEVVFGYTAQRDSIIFTVPIINKRSQKNYLLNVGKKQLRDNLFRFRAASIQVNVSD